MKFTPLPENTPCPICGGVITEIESHVSEPEEPVPVAPGMYKYDAPRFLAWTASPCGDRISGDQWELYVFGSDGIVTFVPVHHCDLPMEEHTQSKHGFPVCPDSDVPHLAADAAVALGWWAIEDREHEHRWRPVPAGTLGAVPDANRVVRERRAWVKSLPRDCQPGIL